MGFHGLICIYSEDSSEGDVKTYYKCTTIYATSTTNNHTNVTFQMSETTSNVSQNDDTLCLRLKGPDGQTATNIDEFDDVYAHHLSQHFESIKQSGGLSATVEKALSEFIESVREDATVAVYENFVTQTYGKQIKDYAEWKVEKLKKRLDTGNAKPEAAAPEGKLHHPALRAGPQSANRFEWLTGPPAFLKSQASSESIRSKDDDANVSDAASVQTVLSTPPSNPAVDAPRSESPGSPASPEPVEEAPREEAAGEGKTGGGGGGS